MRGSWFKARVALVAALCGALVALGASPALAQGPTPSNALTGVASPLGVAAGPGGQIYVSGQDDPDVHVYDPGQSTPNPAKTLTGMSRPWGIAFDSAGSVYVTDFDLGRVSVFEPGATTPNPARTMTGLITPLGIAIDSNNTVYVADASDQNDNVQVFDAGHTTANPNKALTGIGGNVVSPVSVAIAPDHSVFVGTTGSSGDDTDLIKVFAPNTTIPDENKTILGLNHVNGLAFEPSTGNLFASNLASVAVYAPGSKTPYSSRTLTGLNQATGIVVLGTGEVYVGDLQRASVKFYLHAPAFLADPALVSFDDTPVDAMTDWKTVTVTNNGDTAMVFEADAVSLVGSDSVEFLKSADTCSATTLGLGQSCSVKARFKPLSRGMKTANLRFVDSAQDSPQDVPLSGKAVQPIFSPSPSEWDFGSVERPAISTQTFTISNLGDLSMDYAVDGISLSGSNSNQFFVTANTCTGSVPATGHCAVKVEFAPKSDGVKNAYLTFEDNAVNSPHRLRLTGLGVAPVRAVSPSQLSFGNVAYGFDSPAKTFTVTNTGTSDLVLDSAAVSISGTFAGNFIKTADTCSGTGQTNTHLAPNDTCHVTVKFHPVSAGDKGANLRFTDNDLITPSTYKLLGKGVTPAPVATPAPTSWGFGSVPVGDPSPDKTITITNTGTSPLTFGSAGVTLVGPGAQMFEVRSDTCTSTSVAITDSCDVVVRFSPTVHGLISANLRLISNSTEGNRDVALTGTGTDVPGPPRSVAGSSRDKSATVNWIVPADNGASPITGYRVQVSTSAAGSYADAAGQCAPASTSSSTAVQCVANGLLNDTAYYFKVAAINGRGMGAYSAASQPVVPRVPTVKVPAPIRQVLLSCKLAKKIKRAGNTVLLSRSCQTNAHARVSVKVTYQKSAAKLTKSKSGKITVKTRGKKTKITLRISASRVGNYLALAVTRNYSV